MGKRGKVLLISMGVIGFGAVLTVFIFLMGIRGEFAKYLSSKYPDTSFKVGLTKVDIIYGKFYARVSNQEDGTVFPIIKSWNNKTIDDDYQQYKSRNQYNSKIKNIFESSNIKSSIISITGGSKTPFEDNAKYEQIDIHLAEKADHIPIVKEVLITLKEKNIAAERVIFTYEKDKSVYELYLSSKDYNLTEKEIESRVERLK